MHHTLCLVLLHLQIMSGPAYAPPVVYQQGAPNPYGGYPQGPPAASPYPAAAGAGGPPAPGAGWMAAPPAGPAPYSSPYPQQQPYQQQPPYPQQQQQQPYQQQPIAPYEQQDKGTLSAALNFGQSMFNQHFSNPSSSSGGGPPQGAGHYQHQYMPPTTYSPSPHQPGRKKALLVGCGYPGSSAALNGCINDVQCIEYCLKAR